MLIREEQRVRGLLFAMLVCPALLTAGGATADELRADGSLEASSGSVVVIRGTVATVVTPAASGPGVEVIRGAPTSAHDAPSGVDEARIEESSDDRGPFDPSFYYWNDYLYQFEIASFYPFQFHPRGARHFSHHFDEHRGGHRGAGRHFQHGQQSHGHRAGHRVRGGRLPTRIRGGTRQP